MSNVLGQPPAEDIDEAPRRAAAFSARSQTIVLWWALISGAIFAVVMFWLIDMLPPPNASMSAEQVAEWYRSKDTQIKVGATICSWTSAFLVPWWAVAGIQISRQERGRPIWSVLAVVGGAITALLIALPPVFWGVAAFTPDRNPEITQFAHDLGVLTFVSTDQFYIFAWVAVAVICFQPAVARHSPFPRWFGYLTIWAAFLLEGGGFAFLSKDGVLSWNGLVPFWIPFFVLGGWLSVASWLLLKSLKAQRLDAEAHQALEPASGPALSA
jgi:hypothetical protein